MSDGIQDDLRAAAPVGGKPARVVEHAAVLVFFVLFYLAYFAPVLVASRLLAPGDGGVSYLPAVAREWSLWIDGLFAGYPAFADTQQLLWYPLRLFGSHYNALVISAYVVAAFCMYGFARLLSGSVLAAIVAGLVYSGGGFMTAHLGHLSIIHAAAWIPLTLWGLEALARSRAWAHVALVALGIGLSFLGGHPQIWVYGLILALLYAGWRSTSLYPAMRWPDAQYLSRCAVGVVAGLAIASVQLVPFLEFTRLAARGTWTYADYVSYSLPPLQLFMAGFPNLFGNVLGGYGGPFGALSLTELSFYAGVATLAIASLAPWSASTRRHAWFWIAAAVFAAMYMTADATPLGRLAFHLPVLGSFRASGRAGIIYILAVAVLVALALGALQRREIAGQRLHRVLYAAIAAFVLVLCALYFSYDSITTMAQEKHVAIPAFLHNKAIWLPVLLFGLGTALCAGIGRWPRLASALLAILVAIDLGTFGWFYEWRVNTIAQADDPPPAWRKLIADAQQDHARVLPLQRVASSPAVADRNLLYDLPSASGYVSLMPKRFGELTGTGTTGAYPKWTAASPFWDLLGVRWVLANSPAMPSGSRWRPLATPLPDYAGAMERTDFAGRAWLVSGILEADDMDALATIRSGMTSLRRPFDPLAVALIDRQATADLPLHQPWGRAGEVGAQRLSADHWQFALEAERPALLVISQLDYPGWTASVDGKPFPVLRADYAFQAIAVPAGRSTVDLRFRPRSLYIGAALSVLGLLVIAACIGLPGLVRRWRRRSS